MARPDGRRGETNPSLTPESEEKEQHHGQQSPQDRSAPALRQEGLRRMQPLHGPHEPPGPRVTSSSTTPAAAITATSPAARTSACGFRRRRSSESELRVGSGTNQRLLMPRFAAASAPALRPDAICPPAGRNWYRTMTIDWTRKRRLPDVAVLALRGLAALAFAAAVAADVYVLHYNWHHFALVERDGWIADYGRIKNLIETRYPNLDWAVTEARLDLYRLDLRARFRLDAAETREDAERALREFVRGFHDGHLALRSPDPPTSTDRRRRASVISAATPAEKACEFLRLRGERRGRHRPRLRRRRGVPRAPGGEPLRRRAPPSGRAHVRSRPYPDLRHVSIPPDLRLGVGPLPRDSAGDLRVAVRGGLLSGNDRAPSRRARGSHPGDSRRRGGGPDRRREGQPGRLRRVLRPRHDPARRQGAADAGREGRRQRGNRRQSRNRPQTPRDRARRVPDPLVRAREARGRLPPHRRRGRRGGHPLRPQRRLVRLGRSASVPRARPFQSLDHQTRPRSTHPRAAGPRAALPRR